MPVEWLRHNVDTGVQRNDCRAQRCNPGMVKAQSNHWSATWWMQVPDEWTWHRIRNKGAICSPDRYMIDASHWGVNSASHSDERHSLTTEALYNRWKDIMGWPWNYIGKEGTGQQIGTLYDKYKALLSALSTIRTISAHRGTVQWNEALYSEQKSLRLGTCQVENAARTLTTSVNLGLYTLPYSTSSTFALRPVSSFIKLRSQFN